MLRRNLTSLTFFMSKSSSSKNKKTTAPAAQAQVDDPNQAIFVNKSGEICLNIFAKPGSKDNGVTDIQDDAVNIKIAAPPIDGEANKELVRYIARLLKLRTSDVNLDRGSKNRNKTLILSNCTMSKEEIIQILRNDIQEQIKFMKRGVF